MSKRQLHAEYVVPKPRPCSDEDAEAHTAAFITAFVSSSRQARVRALLIQQPAKRHQGLRKLQNGGWLNEKRCERLGGQAAFPQVLAREYDNPEGILISADDPVVMKLHEALSFGAQVSDDMIFSASAGALAFVLTHSGHVILCRGGER
jgi:hypothetical protein